MGGFLYFLTSKYKAQSDNTLPSTSIPQDVILRPSKMPIPDSNALLP